MRGFALAPVLVCLLLISGCTAPDQPLPRSELVNPETPRGTWLIQGDRSRADALLAAFDRAESHGRDPAAYRTDALGSALAGATTSRSRTRAERLLTEAYVRWAHDLDTALPAAGPVVVAEPEAVIAPATPAELLQAAAQADDIQAHLEALERRHPFYNDLRQTLAAELAGRRDPARLRMLRLNLERARTLPADGSRHLVVDSASARLWMIDADSIEGQMRVVVGSPEHPTPAMTGLLRNVVARPYWNVPEDLARDRIAHRVLREGLSHLQKNRLEVMSNWTDDAHPVPPEQIDWKAVADGSTSLRVRGKPGPGNMMGQMKFVFPNNLGIFLHDSPERVYFKRGARAESAGCVRVEDWRRLATWLFDGKLPKGRGVPEEEIWLPRPVPVHIVYLTQDPQVPTRRFADVYGRDAPVLLAASATSPAL